MRRHMTTMVAQGLAIWFACVSPSFGQAPDGEAGAEAPATAPAERPAARPAGAPARPVDPAKLDWLLKQWEQQSTRLKTLDVGIFRTDDTPAWGDMEYYSGRALFRSPNLAFIDFNKIRQDEKKKPMRDPRDKNKWITEPYERIICTGDEVWQYRSDTQQIFVFPLDKNEQKKAIDEGPLPFLFNMRADDARKRYQMSLMTEDEKSYGISIKPRLKEDKESFSLAYVKLDRKYLLPIRIVMLSPDGKSKKDFQLGPMHPNCQVNEKNFEGKPLGPPWKVVRNPTGEERPRQGMGPRREPGTEPAAARPRLDGTERH